MQYAVVATSGYCIARADIVGKTYYVQFKQFATLEIFCCKYIEYVVGPCPEFSDLTLL